MFTLNDQLWALTQWMLEKKKQWIDCLRSVGAGTAQTCASVRMEDASASLAGAPHLCRPLRLWRQVCCCTATCRASVRASAWAQVSSYPVIYSLMNASIQPSIHPFNQFIYISIYSFITPLSLVFTQPSITPFTHLTQMSTYPSIHPSIHPSSMWFFFSLFRRYSQLSSGAHVCEGSSGCDWSLGRRGATPLLSWGYSITFIL